MSWNDFGVDEYELIPEGNHHAVLDDCSLDETKDPAVLTMTFKTKKHGKLWIRLRFNDKGKKFFQWQMRSLGAADIFKLKFNHAEADQEKEAARAALDALGTLLKEKKQERTYVLKVEHTEYNGKTYANAVVDAKVTPVTSSNQFDEAINFNTDEEVPF